jgi:hypothetical protein
MAGRQSVGHKDLYMVLKFSILAKMADLCLRCCLPCLDNREVKFVDGMPWRRRCGIPILLLTMYAGQNHH